MTDAPVTAQGNGAAGTEATAASAAPESATPAAPPDQAPVEVNRRHFLAAAAAATCACAWGCPFAAAERREHEREREREDDDDDDDDEREHKGARGRQGSSRSSSPPPAPGKTDVGPLAGYSKDGVTDKWMTSGRFMVVRDKGKLYAVSAVCPHKLALMELDEQNVIHCPKHDSFFDNTGTATEGPAKRKAPLDRFAVSTDAKGHVIVDTSVKFGRDKWNDPRAFVKVK